MINETILKKLQSIDADQKQRLETKKKLHFLADKVLHIPKAPIQKVYQNADPRLVLVNSRKSSSDKNHVQQQFSDISEEVYNFEKNEQKKRELLLGFVADSLQIENDDCENIEEKKSQQRPHSAILSRQKQLYHSMKPRMRTEPQQQQFPETTTITTEKNNFFESRNEDILTRVNSRSVLGTGVRSNYSSKIIKPKSFKRKKSSISPPNNKNNNNNNNSTAQSSSSSTQMTMMMNSFSQKAQKTGEQLAPTRQRGRMFSTIQIVDADEEEEEIEDDDDDINTSSFDVSSSSSASKRRKRRGSSSQQKTRRQTVVSIEEDSDDDLQNEIHFSPAKTRGLAGSKYAHLAKRASFGGGRTDMSLMNQSLILGQQNFSSTATTLVPSSSMAIQQQHRQFGSVVSGIFKRGRHSVASSSVSKATSGDVAAVDKKGQQVICQGDRRLKIVENQWSFSPHRKFPKKWQTPENDEEEEEEEEEEDDEEENFGFSSLTKNEAKQNTRKKRNKKQQVDEEDEPELKLQCVLEWEAEQAKDKRELAVTFTERFLKVKDGSCRPLKSQFAALARQEFTIVEEDGDDDENKITGNETPAILKQFSSSSPSAAAASMMIKMPSMLSLNKLKNNNNNNTSNSPTAMTILGTQNNKISRLPRSSWHVDFAVQESETEIWKWFTKKLYNEANLSGGGGGSDNADGVGEIFSPSTSFQNQQNQEFDENRKCYYYSSSLLKSITISGCCKGFNSKKFKIPDPPSIEEQLLEKSQHERQLMKKIAREDEDYFEDDNDQKINNHHQAGVALLEFGSLLSVTDENSSNGRDDQKRLSQSSSPLSFFPRRRSSAASSQLPPSLQKAESFRTSGAFGGGGGGESSSSFRFGNYNNNSASGGLSRTSSMLMNNNNNNNTGGGGGGGDVLASIARFRNRKYFESTTTTTSHQRQSQEELERQLKLEEARKTKEEEEQQRRKILRLNSVTFLQCKLDKSADFFRNLASEDRLAISSISLEHCKLPRIKTQEEIEVEQKYKEIIERYRKNDQIKQNINNKRKIKKEEGEAEQESETQKSLMESSFFDSEEDSSTTVTKSTKTTTTVTPASYSLTPKVNNNNGATNSKNTSFSSSQTISPSQKTINNFARPIISPFSRSIPLSSIITPKEKRLLLLDSKKDENKNEQVSFQKPARNNSFGNSSTGTAAPNNDDNDDDDGDSKQPRRMKVAFVDDHDDEVENPTAVEKSQKSKKEEKENDASSNSSFSDEDLHNTKNDSTFLLNIEEDFADAFLNRFVLSQAATLTSLSFHGTRFTSTFIHKLAVVVRSKQLSKLRHLDIGLCGIESIDDTPDTAKVMASAIAHAPRSLKSLSLNGTALSPSFVGIAFSAAIRTNLNLRTVDCVGCDRGGTKFELIIQQMLKERNEEYEKLEKARALKVKRAIMLMATKKVEMMMKNHKHVPASSVASASSSDFDEETHLREAMMKSSKSIKLIEDEELL